VRVKLPLLKKIMVSYIQPVPELPLQRKREYSGDVYLKKKCPNQAIVEKRYPKHGQSKFQLAKRFGDFLNSVIIFVA
jgi:hypothetical protein